ncbi:MAG: chorismate-binding protein [Bacteroidetes bacterium]|nr:chorismate-binding protein [Bacteroidota bacterium]
MNEGLHNIHNLCLSKNLSFVTFRLPQQDHSTTYIQKTPGGVQGGSIHELSEETGFIMAPFDTRNGHPYLLIRPDLVLESNQLSRNMVRQVEELEQGPEVSWKDTVPVVTGKELYMEQVEAIRSSISTGSFQKAVLSRIRVIDGNYLSLVPKLFQIISRRHPNAFAYLLKSGVDFWMGASPEPLLRLRENRVSTVSLAGTRPFAEKHMNIDKWTVKEVLEQEYVTRYIHDVIHSFGIRDYRVSSPYVKKAGNLVHLRTDFSLDYDRINWKLWELVEALHPTPAVAGQPKDDAIRYIKNLEPHDREYYTGFLGPVAKDREIDLFVNLRCMKITPYHLALYVGGGITLDSDPSDEWDETRWKAESLLKILRTYIKNIDPINDASSTYR